MSNQSEMVESLKLFFQKPNEPLWNVKDNGKTVFELPNDFYTERYKAIGTTLSSRIGEDVERTISLKSVQHPDLEFTKPIEIHGIFSLFNNVHQKVAGQLIKLFLDVSEQDFVSIAAVVKDRTNPYLFLYSLAVAIQHRKDTQHISLPSIVQQFPDQFVDSSVFPRARQEGTLVPFENRIPVEIQMNFTASNREHEQRLAYFREDIGVNMHHWHWHLVYPGEGPIDVVAKDRRGELFYYMHNQLIARYNIERFCNRLERVKPLNNFREKIAEGYFPKIVRSLNNRAYPARPDNSVLQDIHRNEDIVEIADLERWRDRVHQAIDQGYIVEQGTNQQIPLDDRNGTDILGNIIEASAISPNRKFYGNLHNMGHNVIAYVHDPDNRHLEDHGVMGDVTTAMRDPVFYRWHEFINSIFFKFKNTLHPYQINELINEGVTINSIDVQITRSSNTTPNVLLTYWQKSDVDLGAGLDFGPGNVYAQFTHLQHAPFEYRISVTNSYPVPKRGTCRIFLTPKQDERGEPLRFSEHRTLAIEMDKFLVNLNPGDNYIHQRSEQSSVTIPYERSFRRIGSEYQPKNTDSLEEFQFCGCGWPQHMLLPKGSIEGTNFHIFVMISNYEEDHINQAPNSNSACNDAYSFCGLKNMKYPDLRPMGYPFDKNIVNINSLEEFTQQLPNATLGQCTIKFTDTVINRN